MLLVAGQASAQEASKDATRILSVGGTVTEIIYALGEEDRLIARDTTSTYPSLANELPDVGYMRQLSPEGVLSVAPDLIIAVEEAGPPDTLDVLEAASIPVVLVPSDASETGITEKVRIVGDAIGVSKKAEALAREVEAQMQAAQAQVDALGDVARKRVLFVLSAQGGRILAGGQDTAANSIIEMAGGVNVAADFTGYKPVSDEAIIEAAPDVILMMDRSGHNEITDEVLLSMPAFRVTPAAQNGSVVRMNGLLLLGFGPRTPEAITKLNAHLYGS
ncbi:MAG: ABC transporter substrate-binding protein [Pseudomonadota bacterium]